MVGRASVRSAVLVGMALTLAWGAPESAAQGRPAIPELAPHPELAVGEVLSPNGAEWFVWADETQGPAGFPLRERPASAVAAEEILPDHVAASPDRLVLMFPSDDYTPPGARWLSGFTAPFDGYSLGGYIEESDARARAEARRMRRGQSPPSRTRFVYPIEGELLSEIPPLDELSADGESTSMLNPEHVASDELPEEGLRNLYFVRQFQVDDPSRFVALQMELEFTAGAVAYLNGVEIARHHVPPGGEAHGNPGRPYWLADHINQTFYRRWQMTWLGIDPSLLRAGENTLAVAVYKRPSGGKRGLYFDLRLEGHEEAAFLKTPYLQHVKSDRISVLWETTTLGYGYVELGTDPERLDRLFTTAQIAVGHHNLVLDGLLPNTRYYYRVRTVDLDGREITSDVRSFRTALGEDAPFSFLAYGDNRTNPHIHQPLVQEMWTHAVERDVGFIVSTGDLVTNGSPWLEWQQEFFEPALPLMGHFAYYTSLGNHEGNHESYYQYMDLPGNESWYSFRYGDAEFFAVNSSAAYGPGSPQHTWLEGALAASTATWKIAFFHHPPYACTPARKPGDLGIQENVVPLLERYGVQLVLAGHDHLYGRSREINGVTYVITGGGGAPQYPSESDEINEICLTEYHYCIVDVFSDRLEFQALALGGREIDRFTLTP